MVSKHERLAIELMLVMGMYKKFHRSLQSIKDESPVFVAAKNVMNLPELARDIDTVFATGVNELTKATAIIYVETFSKKELKKLIKFYKSDVGKKFVGYSPLIEERVLGASTSWMTKALSEISNIVLSYSNKTADLKNKIKSAVPANNKLLH